MPKSPAARIFFPPLFLGASSSSRKAAYSFVIIGMLLKQCVTLCRYPYPYLAVTIRAENKAYPTLMAVVAIIT